MSDIYAILSKHFTGEATSEEELLVKNFKETNSEEYHALRAFWTKQDLEVTSFNTSKGWQEVVTKVQGPKRVPIYTYLRVAASVAAVFLLMTIGYYYINTSQIAVEQMVLTAKEQVERITLPDGSIVYLKKDASLKFPKSFASTNREIILQGEAFFEIVKDVNRPFRIGTNHSEVEVLGTSFNINTEKDQTAVTVATGKVQVTALSDGKAAILTPNQSALVKDHSLETFSTTDNNYLAWKTGIFKFEKTPIHQVVEDLNSYYENKIILSKLDTDCLFTSTFDQRDLQEIIEIIQLSCHLQLQQKNTNYELY